MTIFFCAVVMLGALVPPAARAMEPPAAGVGAHGYDWLIGTWKCTQNAGQSIGGPATQTMVVAPSTGPGLAVRVRGTGFERSGYIAYVDGTWWQPFSYPNGNHYAESTTQTGAKTVWPGQYTDVSTGKTFPVRDTYTIVSATEFQDLGEFQSGPTWKPGYTGTCKKTT